MRDRKSPQLVFHSQRLQKHQRWIKERGGVGRTSTTGKREIKKLEFLRQIMEHSKGPSGSILHLGLTLS